MPENKGFLATNDAGVLEFGRDAAGGISRAQHDNSLAGGLDGRQKRPRKPPRTGNDHDQEEPDDLFQANSTSNLTARATPAATCHSLDDGALSAGLTIVC